MLNEEGTDSPEYRKKITNDGKVAGAIKSLGNVKELRVYCYLF